MGPGAGRAAPRRRSKRSTRPRRCRVSAPRRPTCTRRARRHRLAHRAGLRAPRRFLRRHAPQLRRHRRRRSASAGGLRGHPAHAAAARGLGALAARPGRDDLHEDGQEIPFFMLPALGGGSSLRGFTSWRFRDRNSLLLQAEWRVIVNRFLDMARLLRRRQGHRARRRSRLRRPEERLRPRLPAPRPARRRRCGSSSRRATRASPSCSRPRPRSEDWTS